MFCSRLMISYISPSWFHLVILHLFISGPHFFPCIKLFFVAANCLHSTICRTEIDSDESMFHLVPEVHHIAHYYIICENGQRLVYKNIYCLSFGYYKLFVVCVLAATQIKPLRHILKGYLQIYNK